MRISNTVVIVAMFCLPCLVGQAQLPAAAPTQVSAPLPLAPSAVLQPSLDIVQQTVTGLKLEKWKRGSVRDEAGDNINAILRDLRTNLPPLLTVADEVPEAISKVLPVSRNVDALYDVLLRVVEASRVSAPAEQVTQLDQALESLSKARLALDDRLQESAAAIEKQTIDLQSTLKAQASIQCPVTPASTAPACAAPTPVRKAKPKPKPAATPPPTSPAPTAATPKT